MTQTHIILVRHGEAASSWSQHLDPGLSPDGIIQARNVSQEFSEEFSSYELLSSPKSRAIETMEPISLKQNRDFAINNNFIEIPSSNIANEEKPAWLKKVFEAPLDELPDAVKTWRHDLIYWLESYTGNAIVTTHFMVINVLASYLTKQNTIAYFHPGYTSRTEIWLENGALVKLMLGDGKKTVINL
jgi:broad specificity phosphatase PhoE